VLRSLFTVTALAAISLSAAPALAQEGGERVNQLIIYGDDPCPVSGDDEITVCARKEESERYRIPKELRESSSPENDAWTNRVLAYETVGKFGTLSCTPIGVGGSLGCTQRMIDNAYAEKRESSDVRFSQLIAEERAKRLSTIDAEAEETQKRVEEIEKQMEERAKQEAEQSAP